MNILYSGDGNITDGVIISSVSLARCVNEPLHIYILTAEFEYNGVKVGMDMEAAPIIAALGEANTYFEAPSCAFEGLDKTYGYGSFELDTYELEGKDYIAGVFFCDDLIETPEGVCLFETKADMTKAYGENYVEEMGMLVYEKEGMKLKFILEGNEITSIEYASGALDVQ